MLDARDVVYDELLSISRPVGGVEISFILVRQVPVSRVTLKRHEE